MLPSTNSFKWPVYTKPVIIMTAVTLAMMLIRNAIVGDDVFYWMRSNLFSGFIPLLIAALLQVFNRRIPVWLFWVALAMWILFYPNSPYMISDLIHDDMDAKLSPDQIVFDTLLIFSLAMLSLYYGLLSLKIVYELFRSRYNQQKARIFIAFTLVLSCLGFWMGRELKAIFHQGNVYSWDVFLKPGLVIKLTLENLFPIAKFKYTWLMMIQFGVLQLMVLYMFKGVGDIETDNADEQITG